MTEDASYFRDGLGIPPEEYEEYKIVWQGWDPSLPCEGFLKSPDRWNSCDQWEGKPGYDERNKVIVLIYTGERKDIFLFGGIFTITDRRYDTIGIQRSDAHMHLLGREVRGISPSYFRDINSYPHRLEDIATRYPEASVFPSLVPGVDVTDPETWIPSLFPRPHSEGNDKIVIELGYVLFLYCDSDEGGRMVERITLFRKTYLEPIEPIRIVHSLEIDPIQYAIYVDGQRLYSDLAPHDSTGPQCTSFDHPEETFFAGDPTDNILIILDSAFLLSPSMRYTRRFSRPLGSPVTDEKTGLTWMRTVTSPLSWEEANGYVKTLHEADRSWRLPAIAELEQLFDVWGSPRITPAPWSITGNGPRPSESPEFWTSTQRTGLFAKQAYAVNMDKQHAIVYRKYGKKRISAWAVSG